MLCVSSKWVWWPKHLKFEWCRTFVNMIASRWVIHLCFLFLLRSSPAASLNCWRAVSSSSESLSEPHLKSEAVSNVSMTRCSLTRFPSLSSQFSSSSDSCSFLARRSRRSLRHFSNDFFNLEEAFLRALSVFWGWFIAAHKLKKSVE